MKKLLTLVGFLGSILFLSSCIRGERWEEPNLNVEGMKPIYHQGEVGAIEAMPPQPIENLGKIYYKAPYILMNEKMKGIHIFDNTNPETPQKIAFLNIPGNRDMSVKGSYLYVDNFSDLVCLDISDFSNITEVSRVEGVYAQGANLYPENYQGYFECVDESKGKVVGWVVANLDNPQCVR